MIGNEDRIMRKIEEEEIEKYAAISRDRRSQDEPKKS